MNNFIKTATAIYINPSELISDNKPKLTYYINHNRIIMRCINFSILVIILLLLAACASKEEDKPVSPSVPLIVGPDCILVEDIFHECTFLLPANFIVPDTGFWSWNISGVNGAGINSSLIYGIHLGLDSRSADATDGRHGLRGGDRNVTVFVAPFPDAHGVTNITLNLYNSGVYHSGEDYKITVAPVDDPPTFISYAHYFGTYVYGGNAGNSFPLLSPTPVRVVATDADNDDGGIFYNLTDGGSSKFFSVDSKTGLISLINAAGLNPFIELYEAVVQATSNNKTGITSVFISMISVSDNDADGVDDYEDVDLDGNGLIEIATAGELNWVRYNLLGNSSKESATDAGDANGCGNTSIAAEGIAECSGYELVTNISLVPAYLDTLFRGYDRSDWEPIGNCVNDGFDVITCPNTFNSTFDGNGYVISDLNITNPTGDYAYAAGFFGAIGSKAQLRNVHIRSARIIGAGTNVGLLAGYADGGASIINSSATGEVMASGNNVGALVGSGDRASISRSYAAGVDVSGANRVGGLVGSGKLASITSSYAVGIDVSGFNSILGGNNVGGLIGFGDSAIITSSYVAGDSIAGDGDNVGGLVGDGQNVQIRSSYVADVDVSGVRSVGGLVGSGLGAALDWSYIRGVTVGALGAYDALAGSTSAGTNINSSYWDSNSSGITEGGVPGKGENKAIEELLTPTDFAGGSIYATWANQWCDPDTGEFTDNRTSVLARRLVNGGDGRHINDFRVWNLGNVTEYPAITCTPGGITVQRR